LRDSDLTGPWPPSSILNRNWKEIVVGKVEFFMSERIVLTREFDPLDDLWDGRHGDWILDNEILKDDRPLMKFWGIRDMTYMEVNEAVTKITVL
jgi:hypothetical protein